MGGELEDLAENGTDECFFLGERGGEVRDHEERGGSVGDP